ncbi:MAG: hypothetical protein ACE37F_16050 [Nannocystaceae bacterium]|nr:hypothetical protein [bacterium]
MASTAAAAPGQAIRLGGVEAQGPASRAVTAIHHNPAMLAALGGTAVQLSGSVGVDQLRVRRYAIDPSSGAPTGALQAPVSVANPAASYFVGASVFFDPIALGVGVYDLGSRYRTASADPLRFQLAPDPDRCLAIGASRCPPDGGAARARQDISLALAFARGGLNFGVSVHFPRLRERFAYDNDTELTPAPEEITTARCDDKEDPACAERIGFKGWNRWIPRRGGVAGLDAALTFGVAFQLRNDTVTLGARYRTFPLRRAGEVALDGVALVCRPSVDAESGIGQDVVPPCQLASPVRASLRERLPQEVALGASFQLGRSRLWRVDTNLYWMDLCPGGVRPGSCGGRDAQTLRLVGLDRNSFIAPEFDRFRGFQDLYGLEVHGSYKIRSTVAVLMQSNLASPSVRRGAQSAGVGDGWRLGLGAGARLRVGTNNVMLSPGYAFDLLLPRNVKASRALLDPTAATDFASSGGDINAQGADAFLAGRARPTNAGRYFGQLHVLTLTLSWGEAPRVLE